MYVPIDNPALRKGLVIVPSEPKQTTFKEMLEKADVFSKQCYDPGDQELKVRLLARIVIGSWFLDRFVREPELDIAGSGKYAPIIPIRGPSQSGKNRLAFVLRLLSYRPFFEMSTYRVPSLYRPLDVWNGTLVLDEADFANTSEKSELIHFLNCRATGTPISRQDPKNPGKTDVFTNFGQTILTQRRGFDDNATESRCLPYYSDSTDKKLPTVETDEMLKQGLELQNMLLHLRLEYFNRVTIDKMVWLPEISDARLVASLLPLLALSKFEPSIYENIDSTVKEVERLKVEQKANSEDGVLVNALWEKGLFALYNGIGKNKHYYFQTQIYEDGQAIVPLTVAVLAEELRTPAKNLRKIINSLNLCAPGLPRVVKVGDKSYRVIFFDPSKLEKRLREFVIGYSRFDLFNRLGLKDSGVTQVTDVTLRTHSAEKTDLGHTNGHFSNSGPEKSDQCAGSVTSVTSVTKEGDVESDK
jgi:hypothetical protein